jgi:hypothetical protein
MHAPWSQTWPVVHALPQVPQFAGSSVWSTHAPLHTTLPFGHVVVHWLLSQTCVESHALPHAPQLSWLVVVSMHCPPQFIAGALQINASGGASGGASTGASMMIVLPSLPPPPASSFPAG